MRSRRRALAFALAAIGCALLAAIAAGSYTSRAGELYGGLREVVVVSAAISAGEGFDEKLRRGALEVRRVPVDFAPPDALVGVDEAAGARAAIPLVPGSYLTASALRRGPPPAERVPRTSAAGSPVEITVSGAGALAAAGPASARLVDVVVTGEPGPGGGSTAARIAAEGVPLLELRRGGEEPGITRGESWIATLSLDRDEALRLIRAESFARSIRLLAAESQR